MIWYTAVAIALLPAAHSTTDTVRVCLAPASVQMVAGNTDAAIDAVRGTFTSFLTGPSLGVQPLTSRLASQVREEAKATACQYLLLTTGAAISAATATREIASSLRARDELTLGWRLEGQDGRVLVDTSEKRKASSDGEDVLTPLVEHASESIVSAIKAGK